jgi:hypothetical protein
MGEVQLKVMAIDDCRVQLASCGTRHNADLFVSVIIE